MAGIWASRGVDGEEEEEGGGEISPMCESIGHRPLRGRCPKNLWKKKRAKLHAKMSETENFAHFWVFGPFLTSLGIETQQKKIVYTFRT